MAFDFLGFIGELSNNFSLLALEQSILVSISMVIIVAAMLAFISKLLKQEIIIAYIVAGIILGPLILGVIQDRALINGFAEIGITFLLFTAGLEMSLKKFKETIGTSMLAGTIQVIVVAGVSFLILVAFAFSRVEALWLGIAIAFSSTVVITKILVDRGELNTLHARFIIGIMLAQDIIAIIALAVLTSELTIPFIIFALLKLVLLAFLAFVINIVIKPVVKKAASSTELLFIFSIAFLFLFVMLSHFLNLSIAIGAFIAGITLANTPFKFEIEMRTKALRDFFSVMFFVAIGMWLTNISTGLLLPLISLLFVLIIVEPFVTAFILKLRGYKSRTALDIGFSFAQLSEFTLILTLTALGIGIISSRAFDLIVLTAVISVAITPYTMKLTKPLCGTLGAVLNLIKSPLKKEICFPIKGKKTVLILGCHRMGSIYLKNLEKYKNRIIVIDNNPDIIKSLTKQKITCVYGDIINYEIFDKISLNKLKIVLSTVPKKRENLLLIKYMKRKNKNIFVAVTAEKIHDALDFYAAGADYVITPLITGAEYAIRNVIKLNKSNFKKFKKDHITYLKEIHRALY
jgi:Kef-type K+ transport system membrane component KefB